MLSPGQILGFFQRNAVTASPCDRGSPISPQNTTKAIVQNPQKPPARILKWARRPAYCPGRFPPAVSTGLRPAPGPPGSSTPPQPKNSSRGAGAPRRNHFRLGKNLSRTIVNGLAPPFFWCPHTNAPVLPPRSGAGEVQALPHFSLSDSSRTRFNQTVDRTVRTHFPTVRGNCKPTSLNVPTPVGRRPSPPGLGLPASRFCLTNTLG